MSFCVSGIVGLQLYFSYKNFEAEKKAFEKNTNESLQTALDSVLEQRDQILVRDFERWISDTSFINITSRIDPAYGVTVFTMAEVNPSGKGQDKVSMSLENFTKKVEPITPEARNVFVNHMVNEVAQDLKKGYVFFYTQKLGDSLADRKYLKPIDTAEFRAQYKKELVRRGISIGFSLSPKPGANYFKTRPVNIALKRSQPKRWLTASFANTGLFVFDQLKWVIAGSAVLLLVTLFCFGYMLRLLLTQEKLSAIKDDFINNMTHELHTPLTSIIVTAEALQKFRHEPETQNRYLGIIVHQSKRLSALTAEILASARVQRTGIVRDQMVNARSLIDDAIASSNTANIDFPNRESAGHIFIRGNYDHLLRALANVLDNAVKYSNGRPKIAVTAQADAKSVKIRICDDGPGIPDAEKNRIFDPFYRIQTHNVHNVKGYGLGLSYVKKIVEGHSGKVSVEDAPGSGSCFILLFPK